jgi:hypothetical protein
MTPDEFADEIARDQYKLDFMNMKRSELMGTNDSSQLIRTVYQLRYQNLGELESFEETEYDKLEELKANLMKETEDVSTIS